MRKPSTYLSHIIIIKQPPYKYISIQDNVNMHRVNEVDVIKYLGICGGSTQRKNC